MTLVVGLAGGAKLMGPALPAMLAGGLLLYVFGAAAWNLSGADTGGETWPVTLTYTLVVAVVAAVNVMLVRMLRSRRWHALHR